MKSGQRWMLLGSLFFFFGMMLLAFADWGGEKTSALVRGGLPQSVLSYPDEFVADAQRRIPCYAGAQDEQFKAHLAAQNYQLAVNGDLDQQEKMEIHVRHNGDYIVLVKGPDSTGMIETCKVAQGRHFATK